MPTQINGATLIQQVPTIHPDLIIDIFFVYWAEVDDEEEVEIKQVFHSTHGQLFPLRITKRSEFEVDIERFLANIREHARRQAYKIKQQSND